MAQNDAHNLRLRAANRDDPAVLAVLGSFWDAVVCDLHPSSIPKDQDHEGQSQTAVLTRDEYIDIFTRIGRALNGPAKGGKGGSKGGGKGGGKAAAGEAELVAQAEAAWAQDTDGDELEFDRSSWYYMPLSVTHIDMLDDMPQHCDSLWHCGTVALWTVLRPHPSCSPAHLPLPLGRHVSL